jgi:hypothetical protein
VETGIRVHLHLQQHHRKGWTAGFGEAGCRLRSEHTVKLMAHLLLLQGLEACMAVAWLRGIQAQSQGRIFCAGQQ